MDTAGRKLDGAISVVLVLGMCLAGLGFIGSLSAIALTLVQGDRAYFGWYVPATFAIFGGIMIMLRRLLVAVDPQVETEGDSAT